MQGSHSKFTPPRRLLAISLVAGLLVTSCGKAPAPVERVPGPPIDAGNASQIGERYTLPARVAWVGALDFSADDRWVAVGDEQGYIAIWDRDSEEEPSTVSGVRAAAFHPAGHVFASGSFNGVLLWSVPEGENTATYRKHGEWVNDIQFSSEPALVVSGSGGPRKQHSVHVWDPETLETRFERDAAAKVRSVTITDDAGRVAWGTTVGLIEIHDLASGRDVAAIESDGGNVTALAFSPDRTKLASGQADGSVRLWSSEDGSPLGSLETGEWVEDIAWNPAGDLLAFGDRNGALRIWNVAADTLVFEQVLTSAPDSGTMAVNDAGAPTGSQQLRLTRLTFTHDGRSLAAGLSDGTVRMFEAEAEVKAEVQGGE